MEPLIKRESSHNAGEWIVSPSQEQLNNAANANLIRHMSWAQERALGMRVVSDEYLTLVDSGLPTDTFNVICGAQLPENILQERIHSAIHYFNEVQRPFSWWVGPSDAPSYLGQALEEAGLVAAESETAMAADLNDLPPAAAPPSGLRISRAHTLKEMGDFAHVVAANWTPPDTAVHRFYVKAAPALMEPDCPLWLYVGWVDEEPAAACEVTLGGGVAGLYSVCTLQNHRRKGYATALLHRSLHDAREVGCRIGVLQASEEGQKVYAQLGFKEIGQFTEYKPVPC